jgi:hypothetical protein
MQLFFDDFCREKFFHVGGDSSAAPSYICHFHQFEKSLHSEIEFGEMLERNNKTRKLGKKLKNQKNQKTVRNSEAFLPFQKIWQP